MIQKEKNGTYTLRYTKQDVVTHKLIRTQKRGFKTQKEARAYERSLSRESSVVTFYSLFMELQENTEQEVDTKLGKESLIKRYLPAFETIRYEELTKPYLLQVRHELDKLDLAPKTKNKILSVIQTTCKYANRIYDLPDNSRVLKLFKITKKEFNVWTVEQYYCFEESLKPTYEDCIPFFHAIFFTGMRKGEARALKVDDLDLENETLHITKSMRKYKSSLKAPKTPAGVRKIKLDKITLELLKPLKRNETWLFGNFKPISRDRVDRAFKYGIDNWNKNNPDNTIPTIRIHDLRHSHASILISSGANIVAVSKRLGHANINMTLNTYAHLMKDSELKLIDILNVSNQCPADIKKALK